MLIKQINSIYTLLYSFINMDVRNVTLSPYAAQKVERLYTSIDTELQARREVDLFCKAFLNPFEVSLRMASGRPQPNRNEERSPLPIGLNIVSKTNDDLSENKNQSQPIKSFEELSDRDRDNYEAVKKNKCDNLLSLLKKKNDKIKLAICICMYSEDKHMLKRTLEGVKKNIAKFVENGVSCDEIAVFVIMDGIEKADPSIAEFVREKELENNLYLDDDVEPVTYHQMIAQNVELQEGEVHNITEFVFDDFLNRKKRRFASRKKQYEEVKLNLKKLGTMQKDKTTTFDSLDQRTAQIFYRVAKEHHQKTNKLDAYSEEQEKNFLYQQYAQNLDKGRPVMMRTLNEAQKQYNQYLKSRDQLALVSPFQVPVQLKYHRQRQQRQDEAQLLNQENNPINAKMNLFLVTKYKNGGKLSSHNWFFNGFCKELNPQYSVLLDVGLAPEGDALWKMINHMEKNESVGGVCGYMGLKIERLQDHEEIKDQQIDCLSSLMLKCVDIQRAQQMEYHFAHIIDKPFEAQFKFIHVLPGAFSAYRTDALYKKRQINENGEAYYVQGNNELLAQYFKSIDQAIKSQKIDDSNFGPCQTILKILLPDCLYDCIYRKKSPQGPQQGPQQARYRQRRNNKTVEELLEDENVYLAEDRTLCMGIHKNNFDLAFLPDSYAWVDPMKTLHGLLGQRKRWINGSFFAFSKVKRELSEMQTCETALQLQIFFLTFMNMLAFISPALFLFTVHIAVTVFRYDVMTAVLEDNPVVAPLVSDGLYNILVFIIDFIYIMLYLGLIFFSMHLTNKDKRFIPYVYITSTMLGLLSWAIFIVLFIDIIRGSESFLITNPDFVESLPGGEQIINALRYIIIGMMAIYVLPIMGFLLCFRRCDILVDIIFSTISFLFYGPTYLNILNIYALSRIDDISWGTKGLDNNQVSETEKSRKEAWKTLKIIHVSKFVLWNIIIGFILLSLANQYVERFFLTFIIMLVLALTLLIKVLIGIVYLILYKCKSSTCCSGNEQRFINREQRTQNRFNSLSRSIKRSIIDRLERRAEKLQRDNLSVSYMMMRNQTRIQINKENQADQNRQNLNQNRQNLNQNRQNLNQNRQNLNQNREIQMQNLTRKNQKKQKEKKYQRGDLLVKSPMKKTESFQETYERLKPRRSNQQLLQDE